MIWVDFDGGRRCRSVASKCGTWTWQRCSLPPGRPRSLAVQPPPLNGGSSGGGERRVDDQSANFCKIGQISGMKWPMMVSTILHGRGLGVCRRFFVNLPKARCVSFFVDATRGGGAQNETGTD